MRHMLPFRIPTAARSWFAHTPLALSLCVVGFGVAPAPAEAQARALEEVVVTARKREESLQDTPIAITAFSGDQLREAGISNLADFNKTIPNMEVQAGNGNAGVANIYIRGVGQRNTEPNLDSGVGIYLDGVYISRADGALLDVNDLQSVQVLRGPQGTLFGKNTTGGALVFTTNRPGPEFESSVLVRGGNYKRRDAEAMINIPLIDDTLYTRLSMVAKKRDGYVHNLFDGQDYNDEDRLSAVWQLRWLPHDDVVVDFNTNYGKTAQQAHLQKCIEVPEAAATAWQDRTTNVYVRRANNNKSIIDFCRESQALDTYTVDSTGGQYNAENRGFSTTIDWAFADNISLKSVTGWRGTRAGQDDPLDAISIPLLTRRNYAHPFADVRDTDQYSQEFQLVGDAVEIRL
ncbi:MAG: TonB-dependent receptor plug domain-containing protein, partial [Spongiibacteraceae bacterium]|nr:TonB-dependent receptor plug domain-containing protein [Spongiibacteraceae bacterium]